MDERIWNTFSFMKMFLSIYKTADRSHNIKVSNSVTRWLNAMYMNCSEKGASNDPTTSPCRAAKTRQRWAEMLKNAQNKTFERSKVSTFIRNDPDVASFAHIIQVGCSFTWFYRHFLSKTLIQMIDPLFVSYVV